MRKVPILASVAVATMVVVAASYIWSTNPPGREAAPSEPADPKSSIYAAMIAHELKRRSAPGRTGILAEKKRYSLFDEELIIRDFFQDRRDGFFVDVGCAWPVDANNTYYLEKHLGWRGIGIDALEDYGPAWRRERPHSRFFSYLVTDHSGTEEPFYKSPNSGLSSTNRDFAAGRNFGDDMEPQEIRVPAITLDELLERERVDEIDLLAMDIEGHELEALSGFDIERFQPELVVIEGASPAMSRYFERHGYELIKRYLPFDSTNRYFEPSRVRRARPREP